MKRLSVLVFVLLTAVSLGFVVVSASCHADSPAPLIASRALSESLPADKKLEIQYIANEGVLISSKDKRVLIDGLHRQYDVYYAFLPDPEREKIETAKPPFDKVDLVLVSHYHGDHFHPGSVGRYLVNSPKTVFASSRQVVDEVAAKFKEYESIKSRITPVSYVLKQRQPMKLAGIDVEFLGVGHGSGRHAAIQNLGHVITLDGKKLLHVGDADFTPGIFESFNLDEHNIDIAFLPDWFLTNKTGQAIVREHIKPKHIIAVHIDPNRAASVTEQVKKEFPNAVSFTKMLETRLY